MPGETEPHLATDGEFSEVVELVDRVFNYGSGGMPAHIPNWFDESRPERYAVIERDGRVVSTIGGLPQTFVVGDTEIECWGIGNVATDKRYRGNGYMSELLAFWLERLRTNGVPMAELGGDTKRYNRFGWENAGREYTYTLTERTFPERTVGDVAVRRYRGTPADIDLLMKVHRSEEYRVGRDRDEEYRVGRDRDEYRALFDQHGVETLLCTGEAGKAYLSFNQEAPSARYSTQTHRWVVPEFGGTVDGIHTLLSHLWEHYGIDSLGIPVPPTHRSNHYLRGVSTRWSLTSHRMVNVIHLAGTLRGFETQMTGKWAATSRFEPGSVTLDIADSEDPPVTITYTETETGVAETPSEEPDVRLGRLEMTQLLFGFPDTYCTLKDRYPFLSVVLPFEFYIWRIEGP